MIVNRLDVYYSARYAGYVIEDRNGKQQFTSDGRPLVFSTKLDALLAIR